MQRTILTLALVICQLCAVAAEQFVTFDTGEVCLSNMHGTITADPNDWRGVQIAIDHLRADLRAVMGRDDLPITIGTLGKSDVIKADKALRKELKGKWEKYVITTTDGGVQIVGSDKRGTIFGIYELSRQLGVSPWYWWADAPIIARDKVFVRRGSFTDGEPAVKYRGIFINDEWPSFGTWSGNHFGGINSQMYAHMFELLLRLKANYLWPAMWDSAFNEDDPQTQALANDYGIVMGTSHHEPMMRAHKEYTRRRGEIGAWDYIGNHDRIEKFFAEGVERAKNYDNIITIGMRGDGDVALGKDDAECMTALTKVIEGQRRIIERVYRRPASEVPQLWAIFTEVQRYYDAGFTVPDDVTLLFCDNNWGYIRRTGPERERTRKGGMGLYYHIDMNGGPWNDRWVNTTTVAKMREQLNLAYRTGIDRIWIVNVGDLKPKEMPIDFIMHYAWRPDDYPANKVDDYMVEWARSIFGSKHACEIAYIVNEYSRLNLERKPEVQRVGIYSAATGEAQRMMARWQALEARTMALSKQIEPQYRDAFYQLVEYPAVASAGVARIYLAATLGDSITMQQLFERDKQMSNVYNKEIAAGKWDGMMLDKHIGYTQWSMPEADKLPKPAALRTDTTTARADEIAIMAHDYTRSTRTADAAWTFLPGLGRGKGCMGIEPVAAQSRPKGDGAALEYDVDGPVRHLAIGILPTRDINPARGLRIGVSVDDGEMLTIDARQGYVDEFNEYNPQNIARSGVLKPLPQPASDIYLSGYRQPMRNEVFDNIRWLSIPLTALPKGKHTLRVVMIDPEVVVEKIIINPDNAHPSYYGSPAGKPYLRLDAPFTHHCVLQRHHPICVSGTAMAAAEVVVTLAGNKATTRADDSGKWSVTLPSMTEATGLTLTAASAGEEVVCRDIAIGEVWVASGQSNMAFMLSQTKEAREVAAAAADSLLRFYDMKPRYYTTSEAWSDEARSEVNANRYYVTTSWQHSTPQTATQMSAVAYYFARMLRDSLQVPVGIIHNSVGGSPTEAWISTATLRANAPEVLDDWSKNELIQDWVRERTMQNVGNAPQQKHPYKPSYLFDNGISPLQTYAVAGVLWYQGESNAHNTLLHERLFELLVTDWRNHWHRPTLPFVFAQLSSLSRPTWPAFRDSQRRLQERLPMTGMAVTSDHGDSLDVHPLAKRPVGERMARWALHDVYSFNISHTGPQPIAATAVGHVVTIAMRHGEHMSSSDGKALRTFELCGDDDIFHPATARITTNGTIEVMSAEVSHPHTVRYAWQPFTRANLVGDDGLPASTFSLAIERQDDGYECGVSAAFAGSIDGHDIVGGGCNFPENPLAPNSRKQYYDDIRVLTNGGTRQIGRLPRATAYGVSATTPAGIVMAGGYANREAWLLTLDTTLAAHLTPLPSLPHYIDNAAACAIGDKVYVAGGNHDGKPSNALLCLEGDKWVSLPPFPGNPRTQAVMAAAPNARGEMCLWLFSGFAGSGDDATLDTDGMVYVPSARRWQKVAGPRDEHGDPLCVAGGCAATLPDGRIVVTGGVNKDIFLAAIRQPSPDYLTHAPSWYRFNDAVLIFSPTTQTWSIAHRNPATARAGAMLIAHPDSTLMLYGGEVKPRIRCSMHNAQCIMHN